MAKKKKICRTGVFVQRWAIHFVIIIAGVKQVCYFRIFFTRVGKLFKLTSNVKRARETCIPATSYIEEGKSFQKLQNVWAAKVLMNPLIDCKSFKPAPHINDFIHRP